MRTIIISIIFCFLVYNLQSQACLDNLPTSNGIVCIDTHTSLSCDFLEDVTIRLGTDKNLTFEGPISLGNNVKILGESTQLSRLFTNGMISIIGTGVEIEGLTIQPVDSRESCDPSMSQYYRNVCSRPNHEAINLDASTGGTAAKITNINIKFYQSGINISGDQSGTQLEGLMFERVGDILNLHCNNEGFGFEIDDVEQTCDCEPITVLSNNTSPTAPCGDNMSPDYAAVILNDVSNIKMYSSFHHVSKHATTILINGSLTESEFIAISSEQFGFCAKSVDFGPTANEEDILYNTNVSTNNIFRIVENIGCPKRIGY